VRASSPFILRSRMFARSTTVVQKLGNFRGRLGRLRRHIFVRRWPLRARLAPESAARAEDELAIRHAARAAKVIVVRCAAAIVPLEIRRQPACFPRGRLQVWVRRVIIDRRGLLSGRRAGHEGQPGNDGENPFTQCRSHVVSPVAGPCLNERSRRLSSWARLENGPMMGACMREG